MILKVSKSSRDHIGITMENGKRNATPDYSKIIIVTDAWHPQVNGVVRSIDETNRELKAMGVDVTMLTPQQFRSVACPTYPEIRLSLARYSKVAKMLEQARPCLVHISTEGPLGFQARRWCIKQKIPFTTSYHTRFPEYMAARFPIPQKWLYGFVRRFHNAGSGCMVATQSLEEELSRRGISNLMRWSRGVDTGLFRPMEREPSPWGLTRPIFMTVGRVSVEKNLPAFLDLALPGSKIVVGDGPARAQLEKHYPDVVFTGMKVGQDLARAYAQADVFVFPSRTDTFGNTILESLACGVPVAAYPVTGPRDIILNRPDIGALDEDLGRAAIAALDGSRIAARAFAQTFTWKAATRQFLDNMIAASQRPKQQ